MKIFNRLLSALLVLCMAATTLIGVVSVDTHDHVHADETETPDSTATGTATDDEEEEKEGASKIRDEIYKTEEEKLATMSKVEGELVPYISAYGYELYAQKYTGEVAVKNTATGEVLFTNPYDANQYLESAPTVLAEVFSQLIVSYKDNKGADRTLNSFVDAAELDQISISYVKNGISVDYVIGRSDARRICPMSTTREFFETQVLDFIQDENEKKRLYPQLYVLYDSLTGDNPQSVLDEWFSRRPILERMELYVLNEKATNQEKNRVESILKAWCPHITYETIDEQHTLTEYVATASILPCFRMSLIYKLDENGVTVKLPANSIVFNEDHYTLKSITVLPYMGAGNSNNNGFTFIPDGTGSVTEFKDIKNSASVELLPGSMYGADYAYHKLPTSFTGKSEIMRYPVFGVVEETIVVDRYYIDDDDDPTNDKPYCNHTYEETVVAPTCTTEGYTLGTCTKCDEGTPDHTKKYNIVPAAHTYDATVEGSIVIVPTTCQQIGKTTNTCTVCGHVEVIEDTEIGNHTYVAAPHPDELGVAVYTCTVCGDTYAVGHNGEDHKLQNVGTLTAVCTPGGWYEGAKANTYFYKNNLLTVYIDVSTAVRYEIGSQIKLADGTIGTVKAIDYTVYTKDQINAVITAEGGAFGMTAANDTKRCFVTIEITSTAIDNATEFKYDIEKKVTNGFTLKICPECGYSVKSNITKHNFKKDASHANTKAASCTKENVLTNGIDVYVCQDCGFVEERTVVAAHKWSESGVASGVYRHASTGELLSKETVDAQPWLPVVELNKYTCTTCGYVMANDNEYKTATCPKDGLGNETHIWTATEVVVEGDCTTYRVVQKSCLICKYVDKTTLSDYSHNYTTTVVDATCTDRGYTDYYCKDCGYQYRGTFVEAHHDNEETVVDATCTSEGYIDYKCKDCGATSRDVIPATHKYEDTVVAPTCTEQGYTLHKCTECGHEEKDTFVEPAHDWSKWIVTVDATRDTDGFRYRLCKSCFEKLEEVVPAIGSGGLNYYEVSTVKPQGFVAIITEGETLSTITSSHGASLHPYNSVYITINPRPSDEYNLADALSVGSDEPWTVVSERKYTGNYSLRLFMVSDNENSKYAANVSGMAAAYRDYLISTGTLSKIESDNEDIPLYIEALGATKVQKTILSFPVYQMTALTTFDDLNTMIDDLGEYDITNLNFRLTGFANGGLYHTVPNKADYEDVVGGNDGYKEFASNANKNGIGVFTEFDMSYLHGTSMFDGYSDKNHAIETIDGRYIVKKEYNPTLQMFMSTDLVAISPSVFGDFYEKLSVSLSGLGYYGISSATLGTDLNSDFDTDDPHNREDSKRYVMELLAQMKEDSNGNVMVDGGNAYTFGYANHILNMSTSSSNYLKSSASIPFISMVLHSYISYAGAPTNNSSNINYEILKMIETGSNPYFLLCAQNTAALKKDKELSKYYSIAYDIWMKNEETTSDINIVDIYNRINEAMSAVQYADYVKFEHMIGERVISETEQAEVEVATQAKLEELKKKYEDSEAAFEATIELYTRLLAEKPEMADNYYDNIGIRRLARNAAKDEYLAYKTKVESKPGYNANGEYVTSDFTVNDKSIVYVEYGNGIAFVLNYNNFEVTVEINGETKVVAPVDYISFNVKNN